MYVKRLDEETIIEYPLDLERGVVSLETYLGVPREVIFKKLGIDLNKFKKKKKPLEDYKANY